MKTKLMLASLAMVVLMVAAVGAGTLAYFTDTETVEGNVFVAGTINICVEEGSTVVETIEGHVDLKPCEVGYLGEYIINVGDNPVYVWKHTTDVENYENDVVEPEGEYYDLYPESEFFLMSDYIEYDLSVCLEGEEPEILIDLTDGLTLTGDNSVECCWIYLGELLPGQGMYVEQSYHLMSSVDNWAQSDVVEFDMEFMATQTVGEAPGPTPICSVCY